MNGVSALSTLAFTCMSLIPTEKASSSQLKDRSKIKLFCPFFKLDCELMKCLPEV